MLNTSFSPDYSVFCLRAIKSKSGVISPAKSQPKNVGLNRVLRIRGLGACQYQGPSAFPKQQNWNEYKKVD